MRSSISAFFLTVDIRIVPEEVTLASRAITFFFHKEGIVALLCEAIAIIMEGTVDAMPTAVLIG